MASVSQEFLKSKMDMDFVLQYQEDPGERGLTVKSGMTAVNKILSLPTKHLSVTTRIRRKCFLWLPMCSTQN